MANAPSLVDIIIRRARVIPVGNSGVTPKKKLTFLAELAALGYDITPHQGYDDSVLDQHEAIIHSLKAMRGGHVDYVPLFAGFPNAVPDEDAYFIKRLIGYLGNLLTLPVNDGAFRETTAGSASAGDGIDTLLSAFEGGQTLDSGITVPPWLFDLEQFGADPITQLQDRGLFERGAAQQTARKQDDRVELTRLRFASREDAEARIKAWLCDVLYANASVKEALRPDIEGLLHHFGISAIEPQRVGFKETRTYLMQYLWRTGDPRAALSLAATPTDVLRLLAALTDSDVSLATPITFPKLSKLQQRLILETLERCPSLLEDLKRYRNLWKAIGAGLHPGAYARRYPATAAAFEKLRSGRIVTWQTQVEEAIKARHIPRAVELLRQRPGMFGRRVHHLASIAGDNIELVIQAYAHIAPQLTLKHLLVLDTHLRMTDESPRRAIINKKGSIRVLDNPSQRLDPAASARLVRITEEAIVATIQRDKASWRNKRVWIDPALRRYTVPLQQRKASDGLLTLGRGSKIPLEESQVLRLFVYWKQASKTTDLDLSVISYDAEMKYLGHVSWTQLAGDGMVHSGDLQSAPHGAAEFIDIELAVLRDKPEVRYIAPQIHRYCGEPFSILQCHAGWMLRDRVDKNYASFDIATVQNKFDLNGKGSFALPIVIDLQQREIIFIDLYVGAVTQHSTVEGAHGDISTITREMVRMIDTRPNMRDLARYHVRGRGALEASSRDSADLVFGIGEGDYDALQLERILSELL